MAETEERETGLSVMGGVDIDGRPYVAIVLGADFKLDEGEIGLTFTGEEATCLAFDLLHTAWDADRDSAVVRGMREMSNADDKTIAVTLAMIRDFRYKETEDAADAGTAEGR